MRLKDLLAEERLGLTPLLPLEDGAGDRAVTGFAQSELIAPEAYLSAGEILGTHGMGLQVRDPRTWDAYVERLVGARVSALAFSVGQNHEEVPEGLVQACRDRGVPLLVVSSDTPLVKLSRHVWQGLEAERFAVARAGWELANDCSRIAADGATIQRLLERIAEAVDGAVEVADAKGAVIARTALREPGAAVQRSSLRMPGAAHAELALRVESPEAGLILQPLLGPATAVLAMQLSYTLTAASPLHSHTAARLFEALLGHTPRDADALRELSAKAGFDAAMPWDLVVVKRPPEVPRPVLRLAIMRLRVGLEDHYTRVRFFDELHHATLVMQHPRGTRTLRDVLIEVVGGIEGLDVGFVQTLDFAELPTSIGSAHRTDLRLGVHRLQTADLASLLTTVPSGAVSLLSRRALAPVAEADPVLVETLSAYLRHSGRARDVCEELFIHRNTLAYRIRRIEALLEADLGDGMTRATLLLALTALGR